MLLVVWFPGLLKVVCISLLVTIGDGSTESSEKSAMSVFSWVSVLGSGVLLGRVANSSIVKSIVGCGVNLMLSLVFCVCSVGVSVCNCSSFSTGKVGMFGCSLVGV